MEKVFCIHISTYYVRCYLLWQGICVKVLLLHRITKHHKIYNLVASVVFVLPFRINSEIVD